MQQLQPHLPTTAPTLHSGPEAGIVRRGARVATWAGWHPAAMIALVLLASLLAAAPARAESDARRELVAILDLQPVGASEPEAQALTERLREVLLTTGRVTLVDRGQIEAVLNEQALQQTGCTTQDCAVQVGRILGVRKLVAGKAVKVGDDVWMLSALLVDVETTETLKVASVRFRGDFLMLLEREVAALGADLFGTTVAKVQPPVAPPSAPPQPAPRKLAVFPVYWTGQYYQPERDQDWVLQAMLHGLMNPRVQLAYSYYPWVLGGDPLERVPGLEDDSWSGIFSKEPDAEFIQEKARQLGIDAVLLAYVDVHGRTSGDVHAGTMKVFIVDAKVGRVFESDGKWRSSKATYRGASSEDVTKLVQEAVATYLRY